MQGQQTKLEIAVIGEAISLTLHHLDLVVDTLYHSRGYLVVIPCQDALPVVEHTHASLDDMLVPTPDGSAYPSI